MRKWFAHVRGFVLRPEIPLIWLGAVVILTIAEPFSLHGDLSSYAVVLFWAISVMLVIAFVAALCAVASEFMQARSSSFRILFVSLGMAVLTVPSLIALDAIIFKVRADTLSILLTVLCASGVMAALRLIWVSSGHTEGAVPAPTPAEPAESPAPASRLSARLACPDAQILAVSAADHYITVRTVHGPESVLLRFSDALEELDDLDGLRIHRSHWVAKDGVKGVILRAQKAELVLKDGTLLPISRTYRALVEAEGFPELSDS